MTQISPSWVELHGCHALVGDGLEHSENMSRWSHSENQDLGGGRRRRESWERGRG